MNTKSKKRIFLVGCPRSGTTLLQSLLAAHSQITSFPESKFFVALNPIYEPKRKRFGLASRNAKPQLKKFLQEINCEEMFQLLPKYAIFASQYVKVFLEVLDNLTAKQGKSIWLEKSPPHLLHIDYIEKLIPEAKFIHILRNGSDVVASLYDVTHRYNSNSAWGRPYELDECIEGWIRDVQISLNQRDKSNHFLVKYEQLVADPHAVLKPLCEFIGVQFEEKMLTDYRQAATKVISDRETWKAGASQKIQNANATKFYQLFNEEQREYILSKISSVEIDNLI
ncbi:MAG: sulfotransferase [Oscillatoria sp. PMC 1068.18]|nr:sulfotransferase [Oscillatoria sp. PMC 1076.18]MEC4991739.1 sulfotransferase [Oscillatoria sp. PMC 1068.18]